MNIYEALKKDHASVQPLLKKLMSLADERAERNAKMELSKKIQHAIKLHDRAEEAVLYKSLRDLSAGAVLTEDRYKEHAHIEACLHILVSANTLPIEWRDAALDLCTSFKSHVSDEENRLFVAAKRLITEEEAQMMGEAFLSLKRELEAMDEMLLEENVIDLVSMEMPERFRTPTGHI